MNDVAAALKSLQSALDEHERRIGQLEKSPSLAFSQREATEQRRRVVVRMRESGLSVERIAKALNAGRTTVLRDLQAAQPRVPERVLGLDGKSHPSRHAAPGAQ